MDNCFFQNSFGQSGRIIPKDKHFTTIADAYAATTDGRNDTVYVFRNPYHPDNIIEDLKMFKKHLELQNEYWDCITVSIDTPKKEGFINKILTFLNIR